MIIEFFVPFILEPKQGDRSRIIKAKSGKSFVAHYTPAKVKRSSASLAALMAPWVPKTPMEGPLRLDCSFCYPWRKGETQKTRHKGCRWKDSKPDVDNLFKNLADTMQSCGFFVNDSQLSIVTIRKWWGDTPGIGLELCSLD